MLALLLAVLFLGAEPALAVQRTDSSCAASVRLYPLQQPFGGGTWAVLQGPAQLLNPGAASCQATGLAVGINQFVYIREGSLQFDGSIDTLTIVRKAPPVAALGPDRLLCPGQNITIFTALSPAYQYVWSTGATGTNAIGVSSPGTYWVQVTGNGCTLTDTIKISDGGAVNAPTVALLNDSLCWGDHPRLAIGAFNGTLVINRLNDEQREEPVQWRRVGTEVHLPNIYRPTVYFVYVQNQNGCESPRAMVPVMNRPRLLRADDWQLAPSNQQLVLDMGFAGNLLDASMQGHATAMTGGTPAYIADRLGGLNRALNLAQASAVQVAASNLFNFGTGDFTMAVGCRPTGLSELPLLAHQQGPNAWLLFINEQGQLVFRSHGIDRTLSNYQLKRNCWNFVGVTRSSGVLTLYANGLTASFNLPQAMGATAPLLVGGGLPSTFQGAIDEVKIYRRALSQYDLYSLQNLQALPVVLAQPQRLCRNAASMIKIGNVQPGVQYRVYQQAPVQRLLGLAQAVNDTAFLALPSLSQSSLYQIEAVAGGCSRNIGSVNIQALAQPADPAVKPQQLCGPTRVNLIRFVTGARPGETYLFFSSATSTRALGGITDTLVSQTTTFWAELAAGSYYSCRSANRVSLTITVEPVPAAPTVAGAAVCPGTNATLTATGASRYAWFNDAGATQPISHAQAGTLVLPALAATDTVYVAALSASGCMSPLVPVIAQILQAAAAPVLASVPPGHCLGKPLLVRVTNPTPGAIYYWSAINSTGDTVLLPGVQELDSLQLPTLSSPFVLVCKAVLPGSNCRPAVGSLYLNPTPVPHVEAGADKNVCSGDWFTLGTSPRLGMIYRWISGPGIANPALAEAQARYVNTTGQPVALLYILQAGLPGGCQAFDTVQITVLPAFTLVHNRVQALCPTDVASLTVSTRPGHTVKWVIDPAHQPLIQVLSMNNQQLDFRLKQGLPFQQFINVQAVVTDATSGCSTRAVFDSVFFYPHLQHSAGPDASVCSGSYELGQKMDWPAGTTWAWQPADSLDNALAAQPRLRFQHSGFRDTTITLVQHLMVAGICPQTDSVKITIKPFVRSNVLADTGVCRGSSISLGQPAVPGYSYQWMGAHGLAIDTQSAILNLVVPDAYPRDRLRLMRVTNNNLGGCLLADSVTVEVQSPTNDTLDGSVVVCPGLPAIYRLSNFQPHTQYLVSARPGFVLPGSQPGTFMVVWTDTAQIAELKLTTVTRYGCRNTWTKPIEVSPLLKPQVRALGSNAICASENPRRRYQVKYPYDQGVYRWQVTNGQILAASADSLEIEVRWNSGRGRLVLSEHVDNGRILCQGTSDPIWVEVGTPPLAAGQVPAGPMMVCAGNAVRYELPYQPGLQFDWLPGNDAAEVANNGHPQAEITWNTSGVFELKVHITNPDGCDAWSASLFVNVQERPRIADISNVHQPVCMASSVATYSADLEGDANLVWWAEGGQVLDNPSENSVTVVWHPGHITYRLRVLGFNGQCASDTFSFQVPVDFSDPELISAGFSPGSRNVLQLRYAGFTGPATANLALSLGSSEINNYVMRLPSGQGITHIFSDDWKPGTQVRMDYLNQCGQTLRGQLHQPIMLDMKVPAPTQIELNWTAYKGWAPVDLVKYRIYRMEETGLTVIDSVAGNLTSHALTVGHYGTQLCLVVEAVHARGYSSFSSTQCTGRNDFLVPFNVVTANSDGQNETWFIANAEHFSGLHVRITNRWGQLLFEDSNYKNNWRPGPLPGGVYFYEIRHAQLRQPLTGTLTVLK